MLINSPNVRTSSPGVYTSAIVVWKSFLAIAAITRNLFLNMCARSLELRPLKSTLHPLFELQLVTSMWSGTTSDHCVCEHFCPILVICLSMLDVTLTHMRTLARNLERIMDGPNLLWPLDMSPVPTVRRCLSYGFT